MLRNTSQRLTPSWQGTQGFNVAGAGCSGILLFGHGTSDPLSGFNEAGAGCSGIHSGGRDRSGTQMASMRPELGAPEYVPEEVWLKAVDYLLQ